MRVISPHGLPEDLWALPPPLLSAPLGALSVWGYLLHAERARWLWEARKDGYEGPAYQVFHKP